MHAFQETKLELIACVCIHQRLYFVEQDWSARQCLHGELGFQPEPPDSVLDLVDLNPEERQIDARNRLNERSARFTERPYVDPQPLSGLGQREALVGDGGPFFELGLLDNISQCRLLCLHMFEHRSDSIESHFNVGSRSSRTSQSVPFTNEPFEPLHRQSASNTALVCVLPFRPRLHTANGMDDRCRPGPDWSDFL